MRLAGRRVHPGSLGELGCALGVVVFIRVRLVHWGAPWGWSGSSGVAGFIGVRRPVHPCSLERDMGLVGFIQGRRVHWGASWGSLGSYGVAGFINVRTEGRLFHQVSLGSLR